jgi:hypothetical protein
MSENSNLPALVNRFQTALKMDNQKRRNSAVSTIFADLDAQIEAARGDYSRIVREANRSRLAAQDAAAKEQRHADAVTAALQQGDEETAVRQDMIRAEHAADVEHYAALADAYGRQAELQLQRQDELNGLSADLRRTYQAMEADAAEAGLSLRYQQHLSVYRQVQQELETARDVVQSIQIEAADREAQLRTDPVLQGSLLAQKSKRRAAEDAIRRRLSSGR